MTSSVVSITYLKVNPIRAATIQFQTAVKGKNKIESSETYYYSWKSKKKNIIEKRQSVWFDRVCLFKISEVILKGKIEKSVFEFILVEYSHCKSNRQSDWETHPVDY